MKRKLTAREWMLLGVLAVIALVSGYVVLFYMPVTSARDEALAEMESCKAEMEAAQLRLEDKRRMEGELEEIFAQNANPPGLADYDNLQPIMLELNTILANTREYSLSFATVDDTQSIVRREIFVDFTCGSYDAAKGILQRLHDSRYRCMLNDVTISLRETAENLVTVSGSIVFFEWQA